MHPTLSTGLVHLVSIVLSTFLSTRPQQGIHTMLNESLMCPPGLPTSVHLPCPPLLLPLGLETTMTTLPFETDLIVC